MWQLSLARRNLLRNRRRTLLALAIIALGVAMSYAVIGYVDDVNLIFRDVLVSQFGNFQIASPLLWEGKTQEFAYLIEPATLGKLEELLQGHPEVDGYTMQLGFSGLITTERKTKVVQATGVLPGNRAVDYGSMVVDGQGLKAGDSGKALIGRTLVKQLQLGPGSYFNLTTTTVAGAFNVGPLQVAGIFSLNNEQLEGSLIFIPLAYGQTLLNTSGVDRVIVTLREAGETDRLAATVQRELEAAGLGLEVRTWVQLVDFYRQIKGFLNVLFGFLTVAISGLVFFIILQVLTLAFSERTREVGTIRALGTKRRHVFAILVAESAMLGFLGGLLGLGLGWLLGQGFNALGIGWTPPGGLEPLPVRVRLTWANAWLPLVISLCATLLSSLYPSAHAARLEIVEALRAG